ncbi:Y-family DNA polymerase [[Acholeplasma] multilocale]|uniref:Y-family DNA polymerase n=1 Tax=[Acholeplasma] multilocale TaxID=264638 RepID=UPI00068758ED|nr:DNA polymerase IV [[Acholeplasma] multilocale]
MDGKTHKVIFHLDMDAFFAGCIQAKYKQYRNQPIVVSGFENRSIISAASYEARKYGIHAAMPLFEARELFPGVIPVEADYPLFTQYSQEIWEILYTKFTKRIEVASIDECYMDVTHDWKKFGSPRNMAIKMQEEIYNQLGLTCSVGISSNKFLAKMSSKMMKPNGITITNPNTFYQKIWPMEIEEMFGVGVKTAKVLRDNNINKIGDLVKVEDEELKSILGVFGPSLKQKASGLSSDVVLLDNNDLKSISNEVTLDFPTNDVDELEDIILHLSNHIHLRATKRRMKAKTISIIIRYRKKMAVFDKSEHHKNLRKQQGFGEYTNDFEDIYSAAKALFNEVFDTEREISLIGVGLSNLQKEGKLSVQETFDLNQTSKHEKDISFNPVVNDLMNRINQEIGNKSITSGTDWEKQFELNKAQGKYIKNYDTHISNKDIKNRRDKKGSD